MVLEEMIIRRYHFYIDVPADAPEADDIGGIAPLQLGWDMARCRSNSLTPTLFQGCHLNLKVAGIKTNVAALEKVPWRTIFKKMASCLISIIIPPPLHPF